MNLEARAAAAAAGMAAAGILTVTLGLPGCSAGRWFEHPQALAAAPPANAAGDLKLATVTYVREVCELPKEQRDPALRELNESLVPNHAVIYCGRGGTP
jgi:hypothetical protein